MIEESHGFRAANKVSAAVCLGCGKHPIMWGYIYKACKAYDCKAGVHTLVHAEAADSLLTKEGTLS